MMKKTKMTVEELIKLTKEQVDIYGYSDYTANVFTRVWEEFRLYSKKNDIIYYTEELMFAFIEEYCQHFSAPETAPASFDKMRALNKLDEYYKYRMISAKKLLSRKKYNFSGCFENSIKEYLAYRKQTISNARIQSIKLYLERFCQYMNGIYFTNISTLTSEHLIEFIDSCNVYTVSTVDATVTCLRHYISYLWDNGLIQKKLSYHMPKIRKNRESEIPSAYTVNEVNKLLACVDTDYSRGKRDYAMMLLASRLGLRSSDICSLQFSSINWENNQICFKQQKTKEPTCLPLLKDIGEAIIDYIKNGRPNSPEPYVFLREVPPYMRINNGSLHGIVDKYMKRAKIKIPIGKKHGPHALRHSLSTLLLENRVPLPIISEILAHKSTETTKIYLKIAEKQLLECALPVSVIEREV